MHVKWWNFFLTKKNVTESLAAHVLRTLEDANFKPGISKEESTKQKLICTPTSDSSEMEEKI